VVPQVLFKLHHMTVVPATCPFGAL
jgi:hypothetical protein